MSFFIRLRSYLNPNVPFFTTLIIHPPPFGAQFVELRISDQQSSRMRKTVIRIPACRFTRRRRAGRSEKQREYQRNNSVLSLFSVSCFSVYLFLIPDNLIIFYPPSSPPSADKSAISRLSKSRGSPRACRGTTSRGVCPER